MNTLNPKSDWLRIGPRGNVINQSSLKASGVGFTAVQPFACFQLHPTGNWTSKIIEVNYPEAKIKLIPRIDYRCAHIAKVGVLRGDIGAIR